MMELMLLMSESAIVVKRFRKKNEKGTMIYGKDNGRSMKIMDTTIMQPNYLIYLSKGR